MLPIIRMSPVKQGKVEEVKDFNFNYFKVLALFLGSCYTFKLLSVAQ